MYQFNQNSDSYISRYTAKIVCFKSSKYISNNSGTKKHKFWYEGVPFIVHLNVSVTE